MWLSSRVVPRPVRTWHPERRLPRRTVPKGCTMTQLRSGRYRRLGTLVAVSTVGALTLAACGGGGDDGDSGDNGASGAADSFTFAFGNAGGTAESPWVVMADKY